MTAGPGPGSILHLIAASDYYALDVGEPIRPPSLEAEGFIHCTGQRDVLLRVANAFYRDVPGEFLVLVVNPARLTAPVKYEPAPAGDALAGHLFPHIYGPLNRDAIVAVRPARRDADGAFVSV